MHIIRLTGLVLLWSSLIAARHYAAHHHLLSNQLPLNEQNATSYYDKPSHDDDDPLPFTTRAHWMRVAASANNAISPCPFAPFGTAIVNHSTSFRDPSHPGELICTGVNDQHRSGSPVVHGEMAAFANCSAVLTDAVGSFRLSSEEAVDAWKQLSLYTTAEPCVMCSAAVAWAGVREVVYAVGIPRLRELGWWQSGIESREVLGRSGRDTRVVGDVLAGEMDGLFGWQFTGEGPCPEGCEWEKTQESRSCVPIETQARD